MGKILNNPFMLVKILGILILALEFTKLLYGYVIVSNQISKVNTLVFSVIADFPNKEVIAQNGICTETECYVNINVTTEITHLDQFHIRDDSGNSTDLLRSDVVISKNQIFLTKK